MGRLYFNCKAVDIQAARASVALQFIYLSWKVPVSASEGLIFFRFKQNGKHGKITLRQTFLTHKHGFHALIFFAYAYEKFSNENMLDFPNVALLTAISITGEALTTVTAVTVSELRR